MVNKTKRALDAISKQLGENCRKEFETVYEEITYLDGLKDRLLFKLNTIKGGNYDEYEEISPGDIAYTVLLYDCMKLINDNVKPKQCYIIAHRGGKMYMCSVPEKDKPMKVTEMVFDDDLRMNKMIYDDD